MSLPFGNGDGEERTVLNEPKKYPNLGHDIESRSDLLLDDRRRTSEYSRLVTLPRSVLDVRLI